MKYISLIAFLWITMLAACNNKQSSGQADTPMTTSLDTSAFLKLGNDITIASQDKLLQNVSAAMQAGGPTNAIEFCNIKAMPLLDSLSAAHHCKIERISDRYRNSADAPNTALESQILKAYSEAHATGAPVKPTLNTETNGEIAYFKPIFVGMPACLQCHGNPETDIAPATLQAIDSLYPGDLAKGYALKDFRGAWKVTFESKE